MIEKFDCLALYSDVGNGSLPAGPSRLAIGDFRGKRHPGGSVGKARWLTAPRYCSEYWWARQDSNLGPRDYESPALTN